MRRDTINYLVVGIFVLTLFVAFLLVLYQITGRTGPTDEYFVTYSSVEGIKENSTPVLYEGYQIGQVDTVTPEREGGGTRFRLTLAVTKDWRMPQDSVAKVVKSGLLSAVAIDIQEGTSPAPLAPGSELRGQEATDIFAAVNDVAADIRSLSQESIRPLLDNLNRQVDTLSADLHGLTSESMRPILDEQVKPLVTKLNTSADRLASILSEENQENINRTLENLQNSSENMKDLLGRIEETRVNLDRLLASANSVVGENSEDIRAAVADLKKSLYAVSQHIEAVSYHMEGSSRNMHEFTRQIRENPGLLLRGSPQPDYGDSQ